MFLPDPLIKEIRLAAFASRTFPAISVQLLALSYCPLALGALSCELKAHR